MSLFRKIKLPLNGVLCICENFMRKFLIAITLLLLTALEIKAEVKASISIDSRTKYQHVTGLVVLVQVRNGHIG
jgi:hypothetical protein